MALRYKSENFLKLQGERLTAYLIGTHTTRRNEAMWEARLAVCRDDKRYARHFVAVARRAHHQYLQQVKKLGAA